MGNLINKRRKRQRLQAQAEIESIPVAEEFKPLRSEIIESEKARMDLLKWKLVAVAGLGAVGLKFGSQTGAPVIDADYALCIIPFVCAYVDLLCWHNNMRILVIAGFLRQKGDPYENFLVRMGDVRREHLSGKKNSRHFFELEDLALHWSSIILSLLIAFLGLQYLAGSMDKGYILLTAGIAGTALPIFINSYYKKHCADLHEAADKLTSEAF